jgi:hypothetical protein
MHNFIQHISNKSYVLIKIEDFSLDIRQLALAWQQRIELILFLQKKSAKLRNLCEKYKNESS